MKVLETYLRLDEFIKVSVESYLEGAGIRLVGKRKGKHMKFLGVPSLTSMVEHKKGNAKVVPSGPARPAQVGTA